MLRVYLQPLIVVLMFGASAAKRVSIDSDSQGNASHATLMDNSVAVRMKEELQQMMREAGKECPCDDWFGGVQASECCRRTDAGNLNWGPGETYQCAAIEEIRSQNYGQGCSNFCIHNCHKVKSTNDKEGVFEYLTDKLMDGLNLEDTLLARTSWGIQGMSNQKKQEFIDVSGIHQLHPVGNWRGATGDKTQRRADAIIQSKEAIRANNNVLSEHLINTVESLAPMRSVTPFIAVSFPFCGVKHVLLEGNGRVKALKLAAEQDADLKDFKVEVSSITGMSYHKMTEAWQLIAELWNQYLEEIAKMDPETEAARIKEYSTFKVGVYKCEGVDQGWFKEKLPCPIVDRDATQTSEMPVGDFFGASVIAISGQGYEYKMCGADNAYVLSEKAGTVTTFCKKCAETEHILRA